MNECRKIKLLTVSSINSLYSDLFKVVFLIIATRITLRSTNPDAYAEAITNAMNQYGGKGGGLQMLFVVLPNNKLDTYAAVKKRCYVDYGSKIFGTQLWYSYSTRIRYTVHRK